MTGAPRSRLLPELALVWRRDGRFAAPAGWRPELSTSVRRIDLGAHGAFFLAADGLDLAEDPVRLVATAGGLWSHSGTPLGASELIARSWASPDSIAGAELTGNGLALALDLRAPRWAAYSTLMALPQLYFARTAAGFAAASEPRLLLPLLDRVEVDERNLPAHFLFRFVPGETTYFAGVRRLDPGCLTTFDAGDLRSRRLRSLRDLASSVPRFDRLDPESIAWLDGQMVGTAARWLERSRPPGREVGNLLSGGLDSSLVQAWLNELVPERRSWSFAIPAPSFDFEVRYAREASALLGTDHELVRVAEEEYLELFDRALELLAEPTLYNEAWACQLAVARRLAGEANGPRAVFAGNGADAVHGIGDLRAIVRRAALGRRPGRLQALRAALPRLRERPRSAGWVDAVTMEEDPRTLLDPTSFLSLAGELDFALGAFGEEAVFHAFERRRESERELFGSTHPLERVQMIDLVTAGYDPTLAMVRLHAAEGIDVVQLYLDEAAMAAPFAFPADERYARAVGSWPRRLKPLQQELLLRRGLGALVGRPKGGTNFEPDLRRWLSTGVLRDRVEAIERPAWLTQGAFDEVKRRPVDATWNLLVFDAWRRSVVMPAGRAAGAGDPRR